MERERVWVLERSGSLQQIVPLLLFLLACRHSTRWSCDPAAPSVPLFRGLPQSMRSQFESVAPLFFSLATCARMNVDSHFRNSDNQK